MMASAGNFVFVFLVALASLILVIAQVPIVFLKISVIALFFCEGSALVWFDSKMRWSPKGLFFLGWIFPFLVAQVPIERFIFDIPRIKYDGYLAFFLVSICFYLAEMFMFRMPKAKAIDRNVMQAVVSRNVNIYAPGFFLIFLASVSLLSYAVAIFAGGGSIPIFETNVTAAASHFWKIPGTATIFSLSRLFFILAVMKWFSQPFFSYKKINLKGVVYFVLMGALIFGIFAYGKRSPFIYIGISIFVGIFSFYRVKNRNLFLIAIIMTTCVVGNGYIRGRYGYETFWAGKTSNDISSLFMYSIIQPVQYVYEAFAHLSKLINSVVRYTGLWGYSAIGSSVISSLTAHGKIVPAFGVLVTFIGVIPSVILIFLIFMAFWFLYRKSSQGVWFIIYCIISPGLALLWTSVLVETQANYRLAIFFLIWCGIVSVVRSRNQQITQYINKTPES